MAVTIEISKNGPYLVKEPVTLIDRETGEKVPVDRFPAALCRCGKSENKPFCDGMHSKTGFVGTCARQR